MKKFSLFLVAAVSFVTVSAQSIDDINKKLNANDLPGAKAGIDAHMADPKNAGKADSWYFKGRIYNALSYDKTVPLEDRTLYKNTAYDAFKKTQQLDPADLRLKLEFYKSYLDLYFGLYDAGAGFFNEKKYDQAYAAFTKALEVKDYILAKKYSYTEATLYPLDTALILNAAISATQAKKDADAVTYYRKLVDANVQDKAYEEVYEFLVNYYTVKDDQASLKPIMEKAKRFYPQNEYWTDMEVRAVGKTGDQAALFAKYEELIAANPTNFTLAYNYSIEMYNSIYGKNAAAGNQDAVKNKLTEYLKKAIANDKGNDANMLMTNHLYNVAADMTGAAIAIKGTKPEDLKKKKDMMSAATKMMDEFIPYAENSIKYFEAQPTLKPVQKGNYKIVLGYMSEVYNMKKDVKKAAEYDKKKLAVI